MLQQVSANNVKLALNVWPRSHPYPTKFAIPYHLIFGHEYICNLLFHPTMMCILCSDAVFVLHIQSFEHVQTKISDSTLFSTCTTPAELMRRMQDAEIRGDGLSIQR